MKPNIPLALYIHLPWCIKKCPYCDFNSYALKEGLPESQYIQTLIADLNHDLSLIDSNPLLIQSIFIGGGTPSLFKAKSIEQLLQAVEGKLTFTSNIEITLEANPGTIEYNDFKDYKSAGINRISLGVQSFQNDKLKALGRIHSRQEIEKALDSIISANFNSFNIDLMYGLPNQTIQDSLFDLQSAVSFQLPHLSWYQLTLEPNTIFHHNPPKLPHDERIFSMQEQGFDFLKNNGFLHYEVSAFAKPNMQCQHNLNYWQFGDYLGIGAGAHAKITFQTADNMTIKRFAKKRYPKNYLETSEFIAETRILKKEELPFEFMMNALRLNDGFAEDLYQERTGFPICSIEPILQNALGKGLIIRDQGLIKPTTLGKRFLNDLLMLFLAK